MNILAVYDHDQLQLPNKVLTHREDIDPLLAEFGVRLERLEQLPSVRDAGDDQDIIAAILPRLGNSGFDCALECLAVQRIVALPGYADEPQKVEAEQHFQQATAKLLVSGAGVMCLHQGDRLLVLRCQRGDLLRLPERLGHWFVASAGQPCLIIRAAATEEGLAAEQTGDNIAARYQVLEL
ncbi:hypothetical protein [Halopseudomonas pelagia]|uniref:hypothetical protein n=1 Tax=Halopseudomonas pelagia TaxID=553151 RepID=UPI0003A0C4F3|nr:hypothetical protein [Halopseudomonas pelagia]|tara:strand:- start:16735 stop:17277 length:543 start_codon:yes stop_codon:yes gene_type:complete